MNLANSDSLPIVVDLDGTLIHGDMLEESISLLMIRRPSLLGKLLIKLIGNRATLKAWLCSHVEPNVECLPYNSELLSYLKIKKSEGRTLILATATHSQLANRVAEHLQLFDEILATTDSINLKGELKRDILVEKFGANRFEYIGDDFVDLVVWSSAAKAHVVSNNNDLIDRVSRVSNLGLTFNTNRGLRGNNLIKALRVHQWAKNILIFMPLLTAHAYMDHSRLFDVLISFMVFGLAASAVYLFNDLSDLEDDRLHIYKRYRPFASGRLSLVIGWFLSPILLIAAIILSYYLLSLDFVKILIAYITITFFYSISFKQIAILDVLTLAVLYTIRIVAGAEAAKLPVSFWILLFSMFIFLSLALIKRYCELQVAVKRNLHEELPGRGYTSGDIELVASLGGSAGFISVLVLALYIQDPQTVKLYSLSYLNWILCPMLLFWISRVWLIAHRGQMHDDPIVFALKDKVSWVLAMFGAGVLLISRWA